MSNVDINVDRWTDGQTNGRTDGRKIGRLYCTLLQAGAITNHGSNSKIILMNTCIIIQIPSILIIDYDRKRSNSLYGIV